MMIPRVVRCVVFVRRERICKQDRVEMRGSTLGAQRWQWVAVQKGSLMGGRLGPTPLVGKSPTSSALARSSCWRRASTDAIVCELSNLHKGAVADGVRGAGDGRNRACCGFGCGHLAVKSPVAGATGERRLVSMLSKGVGSERLQRCHFHHRRAAWASDTLFVAH